MAIPGKCCRSTPRCRDCPARRPADPSTLTLQAELIALVTPPTGDLPGHLVGVPRCLHKYEPLLRRSETGREAETQPVVSAPPS
jgi:hypothetical protein